MKLKLLFFALLFIVLTNLNAQNKDNRWAANIALHLNQYDGTLGNEIFDIGTLGGAIGGDFFISPSINWFADFSYDKVDYDQYDYNFFNADMGLRYKFNNGKIMAVDSKVKPYATVGIGFADLNFLKVKFPVGVGVRVGLKEGIDLRIEGAYNFVNGNSFYNYFQETNEFDYFQTTIGVVFYSNKKKVLADKDGDGIADEIDDCPSIAGVPSRNGCPEPIDSDNDGITDDQDDCPMIAGIASMNGCPDTDGDGIMDSEDNCPKVKGLKELDGCPDSDGDGIIDSKDNCPNVAGLVENNGCPDSDGDGIIDSKDLCPQEPGIAANNGCPKIDEETKKILAHALKGVKFESSKDVIKSSSFNDLDEIARIMSSHDKYNLTISGYTDNTGNEEFNLALSDKRAKAVMKYIVDKGVAASRILAKGYGIINPIADNNTPQGRSENRRVEFKITF